MRERDLSEHHDRSCELGSGCLLVIRNIPCFKCRECDEVLYTGNIVEQLERIKENAEKLMQELVVVDYTRAAV